MNFSVDILIIALLSISILLFIISIFKKDRVTDLEKQLEHLTMQMMQENYKFKKKIKVLEEEILGDDYTETNMKEVVPNHQDDMKHEEILNLLKQGYTKE